MFFFQIAALKKGFSESAVEIIKVLDGCSSEIKDEHHVILSRWKVLEAFKSRDWDQVKSILSLLTEREMAKEGLRNGIVQDYDLEKVKSIISQHPDLLR